MVSLFFRNGPLILNNPFLTFEERRVKSKIIIFDFKFSYHLKQIFRNV